MKGRIILLTVIVIAIFAGCNSQFMSSGIIYMQQNSIDKAIEQFSQEIKSNPNNAEAYVWMGRAYVEKDEYEKAADYMLKAIEVDTTENTISMMQNEPGLYWATFYRAGNGFLVDENAAERTADYETWLKTAAMIKDTILNDKSFILLYASTNNEKALLDVFKKSQERNPDDISTMFNVARYYIDIEDYDNAKTYLEMADKKDPDNPQIKFYLGDINYSQGNYKKALKDFQVYENYYEKLEDETKDKQLKIYQSIIFYMADSYFKINDFKNAVIYFDKAFSLNNEDYQALYQLGLSYYHTKNYSKTIETMDKFIELFGETSSAYWLKAKAYNDMGKTDEAVKNFEKYKTLEEQGQ